MKDFVEALIESPMGVLLLAEIEARFDHRMTVVRNRGTPTRLDESDVSDPGAVERAVDWVRGASVGIAPGASAYDILTLAVRAGENASPDLVGAPGKVTFAYRNAQNRLPIAVAVAQKLDGVLHAPMDPAGQEWWTCDRAPYRCGDGALLWTTSRPPAEIHHDAVFAWELFPDPISRWRLEIKGQPRIKEVHRPADWVDLVERWPDPDGAMCEQFGAWQFKSPWPRQGFRLRPRALTAETSLAAQGTPRVPLRLIYDLFTPLSLRRSERFLDEQIRELLAAPGQHAARPNPPRLVGVDWRAAAEHYDAVHLSWAGFLTAEGYVSELADGSVTMLRGFAGERTLWLSDVFAPVPAVPLDAPKGLDCCTSISGIDAAADPARAARDRLNLEVMLGRREVLSPPAAEDPAPRRRRRWRR